MKRKRAGRPRADHVTCCKLAREEVDAYQLDNDLHIYRIDHVKRRGKYIRHQHGWLVNKTGQWHFQRWFSDREFDGPLKAYMAAEDFREAQLLTLMLVEE